MAAIGKIRSWGPMLVGVIGLALFAFIAEELFRSCQATSNEQRQQVGQVLGKKISVQEFQSLVDEFQEVLKITQQRDNLSEEELNNVKDQVWGMFVQNTLLEDECAKLGLTVTEYLACLLIYSVIKTAPAPVTDVVRINIPINLRKIFQSLINIRRQIFIGLQIFQLI